MRHNVYGKHLSRSSNQRTALFRSLVRSLIISEKIQTTEAKAKAIKGLVDKIITQAKSPTTRRLVSQFLTDKKISDKLINELLPRLDSRTSGYTSIIKTGRRLGDGALMVTMRLLVEEPKAAAKKSKEDKPLAEEIKASEVVEAEIVSPDETVIETPKKKVPAKKATKK